MAHRSYTNTQKAKTLSQGSSIQRPIHPAAATHGLSTSGARRDLGGGSSPSPPRARRGRHPRCCSRHPYYSVVWAASPLCAHRGRKAAARREALVDGSAACDPGTPGSVRWCGQAKGMAAIRYRAAPVLQAAARSDEVARADPTRWLGAERIQVSIVVL